MNSRQFHEILINNYVTMIEYPISINKKVGYMLSNGITLIINDFELGRQNQHRLAKRYQKQEINKKVGYKL